MRRQKVLAFTAGGRIHLALGRVLINAQIIALQRGGDASKDQDPVALTRFVGSLKA